MNDSLTLISRYASVSMSSGGVVEEPEPAGDATVLDVADEPQLGAELDVARVTLDAELGQSQNLRAEVEDLQRDDLRADKALVDVAQPLGDAGVADVGRTGQLGDGRPQLHALAHERPKLA